MGREIASAGKQPELRGETRAVEPRRKLQRLALGAAETQVLQQQDHTGRSLGPRHQYPISPQQRVHDGMSPSV